MTDELLYVLRGLEEDLHRPETRRDIKRMQLLLHPHFQEIGRSGRRYTREDILGACLAGDDHGAIQAREFAIFTIADGVALLTYESVHVDASGNRSRFTLRSSLWVLTEAGWQMRFHQATPSEAAA